MAPPFLPARPLQYAGLTEEFVGEWWLLAGRLCWLIFFFLLPLFILLLRSWSLIFPVVLYYRFDGYTLFFWLCSANNSPLGDGGGLFAYLQCLLVYSSFQMDGESCNVNTFNR